MKLKNQRDGTSLIAVLALLGISTTILLLMLSSALRHRLQFRRDHQREQTRWLLRAANELSDIQDGQTESIPPAKLTISIPAYQHGTITFTSQSKPSDSQLSAPLIPVLPMVTAQIGSPNDPTKMTMLVASIQPTKPPASRP